MAEIWSAIEPPISYYFFLVRVCCIRTEFVYFCNTDQKKLRILTLFTVQNLNFQTRLIIVFISKLWPAFKSRVLHMLRNQFLEIEIFYFVKIKSIFNVFYENTKRYHLMRYGELVPYGKTSVKLLEGVNLPWINACGYNFHIANT